MRLSNYFTLEEFVTSQTAKRLGIINKPSNEAVNNLQLLCKRVLEPLRMQCGPVVVSSGYRSPALNKAIGGSTSSQHCKGQAADIIVPGYDNLEVAKYIKGLLVFDQLILEFYPGGWIHVSYSKDINRGSLLRATKVRGKTKYLEGIE